MDNLFSAFQLGILAAEDQSELIGRMHIARSFLLHGIPRVMRFQEGGFVSSTISTLFYEVKSSAGTWLVPSRCAALT